MVKLKRDFKVVDYGDFGLDDFILRIRFPDRNQRGMAEFDSGDVERWAAEAARIVRMQPHAILKAEVPKESRDLYNQLYTVAFGRGNYKQKYPTLNDKAKSVAVGAIIMGAAGVGASLALSRLAELVSLPFDPEYHLRPNAAEALSPVGSALFGAAYGIAEVINDAKASSEAPSYQLLAKKLDMQE